jgi:tetratricopeptide (TPR) repeat protein
VAYSNTFGAAFQFDDLYNISGNAEIKDLGKFLAGLRGLELYPRRFIGFLTFALNYRIGGLEVTGYHILNIMVHLANGALVYWAVVLTFRTPFFKLQAPNSKYQAPDTKYQIPNTKFQILTYNLNTPVFIAFFSALLFVSHPVQTQAVTYIVQRLTSLAVMFYVLCIVLYIKSRLLENRRLQAVSCYILSVACAVAAMMTKEIAFTLPFVIVLYDFIFFENKGLKNRLLFLLPVALTALIIPLSLMDTDIPAGELISDLSERTRVQTAIPRWDYFLTSMRTLTTYLRLFILPVNQNLDYDYPVYHSLFSAPVLLSFSLLFSLMAAAFYLLYKSRQQEDLSVACFYRLAGFGILWFFITNAVESSVIPIADVIFEHRMYLPSVGVFIAFAALFAMAGRAVQQILPRLWPAMLLLPVLIIAALVSATFLRNRVWNNELTLWTDIVRKSPAKARPHHNLGVIYNSRNMQDYAIGLFMTALRLNPGYWQAYNDLGLSWLAKGQPDEAMAYFKTALALKPDFHEAHINAGLAFRAKAMPEEAMEQFNTALRYDPDNPIALNNLGAIYGMKGLTEQAVEYFSAALRRAPDDPGIHNNLGIALQAAGRLEEAMEQYSLAVELRPDYEAAKANLQQARGNKEKR